MPHKPTELAPEPAFTAYHHMLCEVMLSLRARPTVGPDQLFDLADALHNVPEFLTRNRGWSEADFRRVYLQPYDDKWASDGKGFSLVRAVEDGICKSQQSGSVA